MRRLLPALLLAIAAACGGDASQRPLEVPGTYLMMKVNGSVLPYVVQAAAPRIELVSDQLVVRAGGTFSDVSQVRMTDGTTVTTDSFTETGTWTANGPAITLRASDGTQLAGALMTDGTLTLSGSGVSAVYQKQ